MGHESLPGAFHAVYIDLICYVGSWLSCSSSPACSCGWRWWHTLTLVCAWLAIGSVRWYHPSSWLSDWPLFRSAHVVTRWRFVALLGVALAVASGWHCWRNCAPRPHRGLAARRSFVVIIGVDFFSLAHQQLPLGLQRAARARVLSLAHLLPQSSMSGTAWATLVSTQRLWRDPRL